MAFNNVEWDKDPVHKGKKRNINIVNWLHKNVHLAQPLSTCLSPLLP